MSNLKFANGAILGTKLINKINIFSKGQSRDALEIHLSNENNSFDDLYQLVSNPSNLGDIFVLDGDNEYAYPNYEIFHSIKYENDEFVLTIAQLTEQEIKYNELLKMIEKLEGWYYGY